MMSIDRSPSASGPRPEVSAKLLLIDDDEKWCRVLTSYLERHGYSVTTARDGRIGRDRAAAARWDLIILDVMLPDIDGFEVLKSIRQKSSVPVVMLTARGDDTDRIDGLDIGADDYLPKTFSTREMLARIRAVLRRATDNFPSTNKNSVLVVGQIKIYLEAYRAFLGAEELSLTPVEYSLLVSLAGAAGKARSREELFAEISNRQSVTQRAIDVHVSTLRRKLGDSPESPRYIRTVRSHGYMLVDPADELV
jgi:DNA-binding response OmpR family regulator